MASLNKVMMIGNLTRDPELRYLASGTPMVKLGLAVNRTWIDKQGKKQEEASFFNLVAFEKRAEILANYCKKGSRVFVEGRLDARTVTNDKGETRTYYEIHVDNFEFMTSAATKANAKMPTDDAEE